MGGVESKDEGQIQDARYGNARLIPKNGTMLVNKKIFINDEQQFQAWNNKRITHHQNLIEIIECGITEEKELCTSYKSLFQILEYIPISLHKEIQNRQNKLQYFEEEELMQMLVGLVDLLMLMQSHHIAHQNIRPLTISYVNNTTLKLHDNSFNNTAFQNAYHNQSSQQMYDLSPLLLLGIYQQNSHPRHNIYKSDVFSLGMSFLQASVLQNCRDCYDYDSGTVDIAQYIPTLRSNYSKHYEKLILIMLEQNEDIRPDFKQLHQLIHVTNYENSRIEESQALEQHIKIESNHQSRIMNNPDTSRQQNETHPFILASYEQQQPSPVTLQGEQVEQQEISNQLVELKSLSCPVADICANHSIVTKTKITIIQKSIEVRRPSEPQTQSLNSQRSQPRQLGFYHYSESVKVITLQNSKLSQKSSTNLKSKASQDSETKQIEFNHSLPQFYQQSAQKEQIQSQSTPIALPPKFDGNFKKTTSIIPTSHQVQITSLPSVDWSINKSSNGNQLIMRKDNDVNEEYLQRKFDADQFLTKFTLNSQQQTTIDTQPNQSQFKKEITQQIQTVSKIDNIQMPPFNNNDFNIQRSTHVSQTSSQIKPPIVQQQSQSQYLPKYDQYDVVKQLTNKSYVNEVKPLPIQEEIKYSDNFNYQIHSARNSSKDLFPHIEGSNSKFIQNPSIVRELVGKQNIVPNIGSTYDRDQIYKGDSFQNQQLKTSEFSNKQNETFMDIYIERESSLKQSNREFETNMQKMITMNKLRVFKTIEYQNGCKYSGETLNNKRDGYGKFEYLNDGYYEGEWLDDKMHGLGSLYYKSGQKAYEGHFERDMFHGFGTLYNRTPETKFRAFDYRNFANIGNFWTKYVGGFKNDLKEGKGTLWLSNGEKFEGEFHDDFIDGFGQFGEIIGQWKQNQLMI